MLLPGRPPEPHAQSNHDTGHRRDSSMSAAGDASLVDLLQVEHSHAAISYLEHLVSLPIKDIVKQPASIQTEASTVESDLINLCFREHPTFISVHKCSAAVNSAFDDFSGSLSRLIGAIPSLEYECKSFASSTSSAQRVRAKAALVQEHQNKLVDLLELPQLMETCVRNGYYSEAMELLAHSKSLAAAHPVALVRDVVREVEAVLQLLLSQLLALLREPVKLPVLVKTVTFLRRLDAIDEHSLGYVFLTSRLTNFRSTLVNIERDKVEPVRYIRKYIDLFREHVYDIIAQYTSIFEDPALVTSFAQQCVLELIEVVNVYTPRLADPASMSSILVQLGYCAMSFARVGLDFSALVGQPFGSIALATFSQTLSTSATDLATTLREATRAMKSPTQVLTGPDQLLSILSGSADITHFPLIAALTNAHLTAFNALRLLAPLTVKTKIISVHVSSLVASTTVILQYLSQAVVQLEDVADRPTHARTHSRTPSSPRAHLLQRNSETQLSAEARTARRREIKLVCIACADVWVRMVVPLLLERLCDGVFGETPVQDEHLQGKMSELLVWMDSVRGTQEGLNAVKEEPFTPVRPKSPVTPTRSPELAPATSTVTDTTIIIPNNDPPSAINGVTNPSDPPDDEDNALEADAIDISKQDAITQQTEPTEGPREDVDASTQDEAAKAAPSDKTPPTQPEPIVRSPDFSVADVDTPATFIGRSVNPTAGSQSDEPFSVKQLEQSEFPLATDPDRSPPPEAGDTLDVATPTGTDSAPPSRPLSPDKPNGQNTSKKKKKKKRGKS